MCATRKDPDPKSDPKQDAKSPPGGAEDLRFRTAVSLEDFARGLGRLPELSGMLRYAGMQDARTMAAVRVTSARMEALRARALGDRPAEARALRAEAQATELAQATRAEETRLRPEEAILGPLTALAGRFRLVGKVLDDTGAPVAHATVELLGETSGSRFSVRTDAHGIYDLTIPVTSDAPGGQKGARPGQATEGEPMTERVIHDGVVLQEAALGTIRAGLLERQILQVPQVTPAPDPAAPIADRKPLKTAG